MGTLTSLYNISLSALEADQAALNVTANNVANQNTVGYTRESVNFQAKDYVTLNGVAGDGVSTGAGAASQRDRVLEQRVQQQTQVSSQSSALASTLSQVESIFGLSSTSSSANSTALGTAIDGLWSSFSALAASPASAVTRQSVLTAANSLIQTFHSAADQLSQVSASLDQQVGGIVSQVNSLTATIAALNGQIASISPGGDAGSLEDQRQAAIAQLSQYIGLDQISTGSNGITLTTSNGDILVGGNTAYALSTTTVGGVTNVLSGATNQDISGSITGGQLGGVLQARDQILPGYVSSLDTLVYGIAAAVNGVTEPGVDGNGNPGQSLFAIGPNSSWAASSIALAVNDPNLIVAATTGEGSSGNSSAQALAALSTASIFGGQTADDFFAAFLGQVGTAAASASSDSAAQQAALTQLTTQRDSLSGVSLDQEAANLTQYQKAYQAAAQVFSIGNTIMAALPGVDC